MLTYALLGEMQANLNSEMGMRKVESWKGITLGNRRKRSLVLNKHKNIRGRKPPFIGAFPYALNPATHARTLYCGS